MIYKMEPSIAKVNKLVMLRTMQLNRLGKNDEDYRETRSSPYKRNCCFNRIYNINFASLVDGSEEVWINNKTVKSSSEERMSID